MSAAVLVAGTSGVLGLLGGSAAAAGLAVDKQVSAHTGSGTQSFTGVTGGSLTWRMRQRSNAQAGTAEIWTAVAAVRLSNVSVKATHSGSYAASITVVAFTGADVGTTVGAGNSASAASGAPGVTVNTTKPGSWVWAAGTDWDRAQARTVGSNQTKVDEYLASVGDTYWVQRQTATNTAAGVAVSMNDTAPTNDRWNLAALEIVPAVTVVDTTPPSVPQNLNATAPNANQVVLNWSASTDDSGSTPTYKVFRNGSTTPLADNLAATTYTDSTVAPATTYAYTVRAYDQSGNASDNSAVATATTGAPDTSAPTVSISAPADGATLSGIATLGATATDNTGVTSVQFQVTNLGTGTTTNVGAAITASPYQTAWNTSSVANGQYAITAVARDAAGNSTTATAVAVSVFNTTPLVPTLDASTPAAVAVPNNVSTVTSPSFSPPANTVVYAVFSMDQPAGINSVVGSLSNTGTPLTWHLLGRENHTTTGIGGDVEVWWAYNASAQTGTAVTATYTLPTKNVPAPVGDFQILVVNNAAADQSAAAVGANWLINNGSNTPNTSVTTTAPNSKVFAVFDNWNYGGASIIPGTGQTIQSQVLNPTDVDSYWVQEKTATVPAAGTPVPMNATLGGSNEWHALAWEILAAN